MPEWILIAIGASQVLSVGLFIAVATSVIRYRRTHQLPESRKTLPFGILRLGLVVPLYGAAILAAAAASNFLIYLLGVNG